jgi:biotin carboxylase
MMITRSILSLLLLLGQTASAFVQQPNKAFYPAALRSAVAEEVVTASADVAEMGNLRYVYQEDREVCFVNVNERLQVRDFALRPINTLLCTFF